MKANELRIGNYVDYPISLNQEHIISNISRGGSISVYDGVEHIKTGITKIEPIPLTEEWLLKFGLKHDVGEFGRFFNMYLNLKPYGTKWFIEYDNNDIIISEVHQLQNLYFALTGEELTIKE